ncbi:unnamed protein product [Paramecium octaurelia]|uniref:EGF-like domain-containing protein n=1 Tax=Paramecium octaurelia TaxID=43137 RepID=A0A8S1TZM4_PAROT|nr:unnamed protein product [Paramecium octaurelia]
MILFSKEFILFLILSFHVTANWRLIDYSFTDTFIDDNNWKMFGSCTSYLPILFNRKSCPQNSQTYASLIRYNQYMEKTFNYKCFSAQVVFDVFFFEIDNVASHLLVKSQTPSDSQIIYGRNYLQNDLSQNSQNICNNFFTYFQLLTITNTIYDLNTENQFLINFCFKTYSLFSEIGIRNVLIYVNPCHPTCLKCNGPLKTNCLTCFDGQVVSGGQCQCISEQQFSETFIGCRQECNRDYSIARNDKICVQDYRIKSLFTFFQNQAIPISNDNRYSPFIFITDIFHPKNSDLIYKDCRAYDFIGELQFNEGMLYQMKLQDSAKFLRIRLTFYLSNLQGSSKIEILNDNQIQSRIIKTTTDLQYENLNEIFKQSICGGSSILLRIEMIFKVFNSNPTIKIQGQLQQASEFWGFNNVTIDIGLCQQNCKICQDFSKCAQCETGYQLYRNQCVQNCPIHSINCVDYEDSIPYSRYLAKGFYNLNMTLDEIDSFYDTVTNPTGNFATNQKFSILNYKIVLGGLLVWNDGSYIKTWTIQKPHYRVSIYFNVIYGNRYTGQFYYRIGTTSSALQGPYSGGGGSLFYQISFQSTNKISLDNFISDNLYIELLCKTSTPNINEGFCAISDYFIVVHYCPPFCQSCDGSGVCLVWETSHTSLSSDCQSNQYLNFDQQTETYSCKYCDQICRTCLSEDECQQCISDQFQVINGICQCKPSSFRQGTLCLQCNRYCENCFGITQYDCVSCIKEFHRSIQYNQCLCQPGYYDDGINLPCLPICGDEIVVEEEDCDDGNDDPFDGCDQCQFKCQEECKRCHSGKCYQCKDKYQLVESIYICKPICGDLAIVKNEQCDDGNSNALDGCHNCQLQCYNHCLKCNLGICEKCDEINGWYLTGANCEFVCGDGIVAQGQELCDDSNSNPFDLCNNCQYGCSQYCLHCQNGDCLKCAIGFKYDYYTRQCAQICGDNLIVENEQCEDQMVSYLAQCQNCQFKCHPNCIVCKFGQCQQCSIGYFLIDHQCKEICGDGLTIGTEVCDTSINDLNSNCYGCNYNCISGCLICNQGICQICQDGYFLDQFLCKPTCGDQLIVESELCDDGNLIPYDGCDGCNFSCEISCSLCEFGKCIYNNDDPISSTFDCTPNCKLCEQQNICSDCEEYFQLINNHCVPVCGDGIIIEGLEECDDGNNLPDDGCYLCQFQCSNGCVDCQQSQCKKCDDVYYTLDIQTAKCLEKIQDQTDTNVDPSILEQQQYTVLRCGENQLLVDNICVNQCGNGILINQYEECDDGNRIGGDGCSSFCNIENSYKCVNQEGSLSQCTFIRSPEFVINILSDKMNSTQILELTFTQDVRLQTEIKFDELVFFTIATQTQYLLTISHIQNISTHLSSPKYQISIEFLEPIKDPILQVDIERSIIQNQFEQDLQDYQKTILLGTPFVLPESSKQQLTSIVEINDVMMYTMVSVSSLALLTGNAVMFFNLLDLLQSLSYIKFMQYQFPPHLKEFLDTYTKVSLQPIMNYFQVDQLLANLNGGTLPYQVSNKSPQKPTANALNQFYLINAKSCYFSVLASILTYLIYCVIVSDSVQKILFKFYNEKNPNSKILKCIDFFQEKIQKKCLKLKFEYFSLGIFKLYQAILHQLIFSTLLQFPNYQFNSAFEIFNSINAMMGLLFVCFVAFNLFTITSAEIKDLRKWKYFYFESKTSFWQVQCKSFQIYRVLFYIMIIVQLMNYPEAQSILLSMLSFFYLIYLIKYKPLQSQYELRKLICRELLVMLITGTFLIYSFDFSQDSYMLFGWVHIGMFCSILASNLFIDIYVQIHKIYDSYQQKKIKDKNEQERKYFYNQLQNFLVNDQNYTLQNRHN